MSGKKEVTVTSNFFFYRPFSYPKCLFCSFMQFYILRLVGFNKSKKAMFGKGQP